MSATYAQQPNDLLRQRTLSGIAWTSGARVGQQAIQFGIAVLLARLLTPADFGLIGMVTVLLGFAAVVAEFGLGSALIHRFDLSEVQMHSAFWLNIAVGVVLFAVFTASAPLISEFYQRPELEPLVTGLALSFLVGAFGIVPRALLRRRMLFRQLARIDILASALSGTLALGCALKGWGVWSLVVQSLSATLLTTLLVGWYARWIPRPLLSLAAVQALFGFSANMFGFNLVYYWARNLDNLLIGRLLGPGPLGVYSRAYSLMLLPVAPVHTVLGAVMFPALASIQDDVQRVKRIYLRSIRLIAFVTLPMMLGLFVAAEPFVLTLLGKQWAGVVPIIRILCLAGAVQSVCDTTGWIYMSQGRTDWMFRWGLVSSGTLILAIIIGAKLGTVESIAWAYVIANLFLAYPSLAIAGKLIDLRFWEFVRAVSPPIGCAMLMGIVIIGSTHVIPRDWPAWAQLLVQVAIGTLTYVALAAAARLTAYTEIRDLILKRRPLKILSMSIST